MKIANVFFMLLLTSVSMAQTVDYNKIITPKEYDGDNAVEEKLVRLAWQNHPMNETYQDQVEIAEKNVSLSKWGWTKNMRAVYNINDNTLGSGPAQDPNATGRLLAYPKYNIALGVSLGDIITTPTSIKIAKKEVTIAGQMLNAQKLKVRAEVLEQYYNYQLANQLLQIRTEENEDTYANFLTISEKFKIGEATLDEYNKITNSYSIVRATLLQQEMQAKIEKARLESYIGVSLESAL